MLSPTTSLFAFIEPDVHVAVTKEPSSLKNLTTLFCTKALNCNGVIACERNTAV